MTIKKIIGILGFLIIGALYLSACQNNVNTTLEDSVAPYLELQALQEASNATAIVNRGETKGLDSYFALDLSNINTHGLVREGLTEGWCLEWDKPLDQNNDVHTGLELYSTYGNNSWKPANYLMNIKNELKAADSKLTYREIQVALWSLIKTPQFNMDEVLSSNRMPQRMMRNGEPNFDVNKVRQIVNRVNSEVSDFSYKPGTPVIAYSHHANNNKPKQDFGVVLSGSAWGLSTDSDKVANFCGEEWINLDGDSENMPSKWGWSNGTYRSGDSDTFDIYVGASHCDINNGDFVGTFNFTYENGIVTYSLNLTKNNDLANLHLHIGNEILPRNGNGNGNSNGNGNGNGNSNGNGNGNGNSNGNLTGAPGKFDTNVELDGGIKEYTGTVNNLQGDIYISVHLGDSVESYDD